MKTIYFSPKKLFIYSLFGFFSVMISSCGSYQNSSYQDGDGIYGTSEKRKLKLTLQTKHKVVNTKNILAI